MLLVDDGNSVVVALPRTTSDLSPSSSSDWRRIVARSRRWDEGRLGSARLRRRQRRGARRGSFRTSEWISCRRRWEPRRSTFVQARAAGAHSVPRSDGATVLDRTWVPVVQGYVADDGGRFPERRRGPARFWHRGRASPARGGQARGPECASRRHRPAAGSPLGDMCVPVTSHVELTQKAFDDAEVGRAVHAT